MSATSDKPTMAADEASGGMAAASDFGPPGRGGGITGPQAGRSARALLSFAARDLHRELLTRLRQQGFDWG